MDQCALLFIGGKAPASLWGYNTIPKYSYVCAADSGVDTALALGYTLDYAVGDFDSLSNVQLLANIPHSVLPQEKEITDTEALLIHINRQGYTSYILVGGGEGRFDHLLHLYTLFSVYRPPLLWITAAETMHLVSSQHSFSLAAGTSVSVIPALIHGKSRVTSRNLVWELQQYSISLDQQSISNKVQADPIHIAVLGSPVFLSIPYCQEKRT